MVVGFCLNVAPILFLTLPQMGGGAICPPPPKMGMGFRFSGNGVNLTLPDNFKLLIRTLFGQKKFLPRGPPGAETEITRKSLQKWGGNMVPPLSKIICFSAFHGVKTVKTCVKCCE